jgi:hypothetical protein
LSEFVNFFYFNSATELEEDSAVGGSLDFEHTSSRHFTGIVSMRFVERTAIAVPNKIY